MSIGSALSLYLCECSLLFTAYLVRYGQSLLILIYKGSVLIRGFPRESLFINGVYENFLPYHAHMGFSSVFVAFFVVTDLYILIHGYCKSSILIV